MAQLTAVTRHCARWFWLLPLLLTVACRLAFNSPPQVMQVGLADLDGDGNLDAFIANGRTGEPYTYPEEIRFEVLYGDGTGAFAPRIPPVHKLNTSSVALGDLTGDGAQDAVLVGWGPVVRPNDGAGNFPRQFGLDVPGDFAAGRGHVELADLDGDGSLDIFVAFCCGGAAQRSPTDRWLLYSPNFVWLNNGSGGFSDTGQSIGRWGSNAVALADLNADGAVDAFVANGQTNMTVDGEQLFEVPNRVWWNDGHGTFTDSGQLLGAADSRAVALSDVNGDGFLDAIVGNDGPDEVWINDGSGGFTLLPGTLDHRQTRAVFLADVDRDGDPDLFAVGDSAGRFWHNDGSGSFSPAGSDIPVAVREAATLGDIDGDGAVDVFIAAVDGYRVWLNDGAGAFKQRETQR